jgi:hypothetical protein
MTLNWPQGSGSQRNSADIFETKVVDTKVLDKYPGTTMSTTFYVNVSTLTYLNVKDRRKHLLLPCFDQNTARSHQDPLTQQQGGKFGHKTTPFSSVWGVLI